MELRSGVVMRSIGTVDRGEYLTKSSHHSDCTKSSHHLPRLSSIPLEDRRCISPATMRTPIWQRADGRTHGIVRSEASERYL
eukprot:scaffold5490_cov148-Skeletonema_marinoi.AAC.5